MNKQIFLENLTTYDIGTYKGKINWKECIGRSVHFIYEDIEGDIEIVDFTSKGQKLIVKYNNEEHGITTSAFIKCYIGSIIGRITKEFKYEIGQRLIDYNNDSSIKRDITIIDRKYVQEEQIDKLGRKSIANRKYYKYECNLCGFYCGEHYRKGKYNEECWIIESSLIGKNKSGCACCSSSSKATVKGINDIATTHPHLVKYFKNIEDAYAHSYGSGEKILVKCMDCGCEKRIAINKLILKGFSCPKCGDNIPYGEKIMFNVLDQLGINFQIQLNKITYEWCKDYRYDFYFKLNGEKILTETHGMQHYKKSFSTIEGAKTLDEEIENDRLKKELALTNGIKPENYIIIDCRESTLEWIKNNILNSKLNELFDLSSIDWLKAEEFALSNRVKEVCDLWNNNSNITTTKISELTKLSSDTIRVYLKQGATLGWNNYNSELEIEKTLFKKGNIPYNIKEVEVFKDGISKGIYTSAREIDRKSKELFGVKLDYRSISAVCLGRTKQHNGFIFKFVNQDIKEVAN
jgi:hypothetical protein